MNDSAAGARWVTRMTRAIDAHDLDAVVDCFAPDYRSDTPIHPDRDFVGREHVRDNWTGLLREVADLHMTVVRMIESKTSSSNESVVWVECEFTGTRDGRAWLQRGVTITGVSDQQADWVRFYVEPVQTDPPA